MERDQRFLCHMQFNLGRADVPAEKLCRRQKPWAALEAISLRNKRGDRDHAYFSTGGYQVKPAAVNKVKKAIEELVEYVRKNEPGTQMYLAWQEKSDPTRFLHLFIFADEAAQKRHGPYASDDRGYALRHSVCAGSPHSRS